MKTIIFGINEISTLANFYLKNDSSYEPCAFSVNAEYLKDSKIEGIPVVPFEEIEKYFSPDEFLFFAPLYDNKKREEKANEILKKKYKLISYISTKSNIMSNNIGYNCFILENNVIQPYVEIGNNVILWSGNHIGHHSKIEDNVFFSSHVVLSGKCCVKKYSWLGVNSCTKDSIEIEEGSFIAMGSVLTKSTKPYKKYVGNPAREYGSLKS